jgi:endoglucanase
MERFKMGYRFNLLIILFTKFILSAVAVNAQGFLRTEGTIIVNEKGENVLLRGMGLGGWMLQEGYMLKVHGQGQQHKIKARITELIGAQRTEEFYAAWLTNHTRKIDIDSMKAWGFNSVRLPMHFNLYTLPVEDEPVKGENTWLEKGFQITDSLLSWCRSNKMYLILDLHAAPGGQGNDLNISDRDESKPSLWESEANQQKTIALWKKLAERYVNEPWIGAYDILNEPNWGFEDPANDKNGLKESKNEPLKKLMVQITHAIREVDKRHIIIIEGNGWGNNYKGILPPWDNNMVLSFHKYWNYNNQASVQYIVDTREKYKVPVWLGETGENSNVWFTDAIHLLELNNIGWAWWPLKKLGNNNPIQVRSNPGYEKILDYWTNRGPKPTEADAYKGVMELAEATKLENTTIKWDVVDAMFRQPHSYATRPFNNNTIDKGTVLKAVHYDLGRNGVAYFDRDTANYHVSTGTRSAGNRGNIYRNDGVDIELDSVDLTFYYVSHFEKGEWLNYTVNITKGGRYTLNLRLSAKKIAGKLTLRINSGTPHQIDIKPGLNWQEITIMNVDLKKGNNTIRVIAEEGEMDFAWIKFH